MQIPTASEANEFGIGSSIVALTTVDKWITGIVINNIWTFGDVSESKFLF